MDLRSLRDHLLPVTESDPKFREHLRRLSASGVGTLAIAEMAIPLFLLGGRMALTPETAFEPGRLFQAFAVIAVGVLTVAFSRIGWASRNPRLLACLSAWAAPSALLAISLWKPPAYLSTDDYVIAGISLIVITAAATVPLLPWHSLALGLSVEGVYILSCWLAVRWEIPSSYAESESHYIFLVMVAFLATGISATNYQHHRGEYSANREAIRVAEALTGAQLRAQLAESAISIGKMAATLSHEINSPLGTLRSSVETLIVLTDRQIDATPEKRQQLQQTRADLQRSIEESASRIQEVARRLRRFINLDDSELKAADLNELLTDVTVLHEKELQDRGIQLEFDLEKSLPPLTCRPQLLTAVFSNLLSNAIQAVNGDGHISISTRRSDSAVEVTVRDNGRGMPPEAAETIFDPSFKVDGRRVATGNWSLFNTRQMVYEHGGNIRVETAEGKGTAVFVMLPL